MSQPNLSTPSSNAGQPANSAIAASPQTQRLTEHPLPSALSWHRAWRIGGWTLASLAAIDVAVNQLFAYPTHHPSAPSSVETYFNYGRSGAGKLAQMVGPTDESSHVLARAGWLGTDPLSGLTHFSGSSTKANAPSVAFYGMSFTLQLGEAMAEIAPEVAQRHIAAPSGGPSYAFAAYEADGDRHQSEIVVLGVMADSVKTLKTLTAASWMFASPSAYSYPRYRLEAETLVKTEPVVNSLDQLRDALADPEQWQRYRDQLAAQDAFYHPAIFERSWLDHSAIARLVRRSFAQQHLRQAEAQIYNPEQGFVDPETNALLKAIVKRFASQARDRGQLPIVLLIDSQNYDDHLFQVLGSVLEQHQIDYLSTHQIAPANDPQNYIPDGHFTAAVNQNLARALADLIQQRFEPGLAPVSQPVESSRSEAFFQSRISREDHELWDIVTERSQLLTGSATNLSNSG